MFVKVTISKITRKETDGKYGKSNRVSIQIREATEVDGDSISGQWMSCFFKPTDSTPDNWSEGTVVDISITKKGDFYNFNVGAPKADYYGLEKRVASLEKEMEKHKRSQTTSDTDLNDETSDFLNAF